MAARWARAGHYKTHPDPAPTSKNWTTNKVWDKKANSGEKQKVWSLRSPSKKEGGRALALRDRRQAPPEAVRRSSAGGWKNISIMIMMMIIISISISIDSSIITTSILIIILIIIVIIISH